MAKNKTLKVLSTGTVAGMIAAAVLSSQAFAAVDAYSVKIGDDVLKYDKAALTESFLASKAGDAAPLYEDFTAKLAEAKGFYAFSDAKTGKFVSYNDIQAKFLEAKAAGEAFVVDNYTESATAEVIAVPTVKKVVVKDGKVVVEAQDGTTTPTTGVVSVSAINWTAAQSVATGQSLFEAGTITLKAGDKGGTITGLKINRTGLSSDDDVDSISIWDGTKRLNVPNIFANGSADITFADALVLSANETKTISIKVNVDTDAKAGSQILLSLPSNAVKATAAVNGSTASTSGAYTVAKVELAQVFAKTSASAPTQTLKPGVNNQSFAEWQIEGTNEPIAIKTLILTQDGSASDSDLKNFKLYKDGVQVGATVESLANRTLTFTFADELKINKGDNIRLELRGDVVSGSTRDVEFKINNDVDLMAVDQTYGTNVTLTTNPSYTINDNIPGTTAGLSIDTGSIVTSKSADSPSAANIDQKAKNVVFTTIKVESVGESVQLRKVKLTANVTDGNEKELENVKLVTKSGTTLAQVQNPFKDAAGDSITTYEVTLSNPITLKPDESVEINLVADVNSTTAGRQFTLGAAVTEAIGTLSGRKVDASHGLSVGVNGVPMTIGTVKVDIAATPTSETVKYVFASQSNVDLATYTIKHNINKEIKLYNIKLAATETPSVIKNAKLVDANGEALSDVVTTLASGSTLTLKQPIVIKPGQVVSLTLKGDILSTATNQTTVLKLDDTDAAGTVVRYSDSGEVVDVAYSTNNDDTITVSSDNATITSSRSVKADLDPVVTVQRGAKDVKAAAYTIKESGKAQGISIDKVTLTKLFAAGAQSKDITNIRIADKDGKVYGTLSSFVNNDEVLTLTEPFTVNKDSDKELYVLFDVASNAERGGETTLTLTGFEYTNSATGTRVPVIAAQITQGTPTKHVVTPTNVKPVANTIATNVSALPGVTLASFAFPNTGSDDINIRKLELIDTRNVLASTTGTVLDIIDAGGNLRGTINVDVVTDGGNAGVEKTMADGTKVTYTAATKTFEVELASGRRIDSGASNTLNIQINTVGNLVEKAVQFKLGQFKTQYERVTAANTFYAVDGDVTAAAVVLSPSDNVTYTDIVAPTTTIANAVYDATSNTITLTGTNFDTVAIVGADAKNILNWSKVSIDATNADPATVTSTIATSDVKTAIVTSATTLTITLSDAKAADLEIKGLDLLTVADTITITAGFAKDAAGNTATTDALAVNGLDS